jgi:hypothetical protein
MDLERFDKNYEDAPTVSSSSTDLPEGKYVAKIVDTDVFEAKDTGIPYFKIVMEVAEGDLKGSKTQKIHRLDDPERFKYLKTDLQVCGLYLSKISELPRVHEKMRGILVNIQTKKKDKYTNHYINAQTTTERAAASTDEKVPF